MMTLTRALYLAVLLLFTPLAALAQEEARGGIVAESFESGGYLYLRLEEPETWIATSPNDIKVGDRVEFTGGMLMNNFQSRTLERTFDSIWFVQSVTLAGRDIASLHESAQSGHVPTPGHIQKPEAVAAPAKGEIEPLDGGVTVAGITAEPGTLEGQAVRLRAKVIKTSANIMGKNWVTLQDGSGETPGDKLIATTTETVSAGDIVIAEGTIRTNVDLGSGYLYKVLLEKATFSN
jgi:hypothetical protein